MIAVSFVCGHVCDLKGDEDPPTCTVCGERQVERVTAPAPTFRGWARGPCAEYKELPAQEVSFDVKKG